MCCLRLCVFLFFFFFKQKTAYEMRISDWSSDVCSSDLQPPGASHSGPGAMRPAQRSCRARRTGPELARYHPLLNSSARVQRVQWFVTAIFHLRRLKSSCPQFPTNLQAKFFKSIKSPLYLKSIVKIHKITIFSYFDICKLQ